MRKGPVSFSDNFWITMKCKPYGSWYQYYATQTFLIQKFFYRSRFLDRFRPYFCFSKLENVTETEIAQALTIFVTKKRKILNENRIV